MSSSVEFSPAPVRRALLAWYRRAGRSLPWRERPTAWRVWVSEMMLQQTTVATVLPRYEAFLQAFPSVEALAAAPLGDVLAGWSGLGYYTRARNLHAAAGIVASRHGGRFPRDRAVVRALPGFGDYSTAAILSIVYGAPLAVVDGNVIRVLARVCTLPGHAKSGALKRLVQAEADRLIDPKNPGDFNQAVMELGATVCTPTSPRCDTCPVARWCGARAAETPTAWPEAPPRQPTRDESWRVALIESRGRVLMRLRPESERLMPGLWELPAWPSGDEAEFLLRLREDVAPGVVLREYAGQARHAIMNRRMVLTIQRADLAGSRAPVGWQWISREEVGRLPVSSMVTKALKAAGAALRLGLAVVMLAGAGAGTAAWAATSGETETAAPAGAPAAGEAAAPATAPEAPVVVIPPLKAKAIDGSSVSLHELLARGPVLVNFWALWCKPCLKELPELQGLQDSFGARGLTVLAINGDSPADVAKVSPFVKSRRLGFPVLTDVDGALRRRFQANAFPTSLLLDTTGRVVWTSQGFRPGDEVKLAKEIERLLPKGAASE